jgi:hypothetical protein
MSICDLFTVSPSYATLDKFTEKYLNKHIKYEHITTTNYQLVQVVILIRHSEFLINLIHAIYYKNKILRTKR